jgi:predicted anti-sigma-YlaC factor YlaD
MIMSPMRIGTERHPDRQDVLEQHVAAQVADLHQRKIIPMVGRRAPLLAVIFVAVVETVVRTTRVTVGQAGRGGT